MRPTAHGIVLVLLQNAKFLLRATFIVAVFIVIRCVWLWQPERQVLLHQRHLLDAVERGDWTRAGEFIDAGYQDRAGQDKVALLQQAREVVAQFFSMSIVDATPDVTPTGARAQLRTRLRLNGAGTPLADYIKTEVNSATQPFQFTWEQKSAKPWDWRLVTIDHPLMTRAGEGF